MQYLYVDFIVAVATARKVFLGVNSKVSKLFVKNNSLFVGLFIELLCTGNIGAVVQTSQAPCLGLVFP